MLLGQKGSDKELPLAMGLRRTAYSQSNLSVIGQDLFGSLGHRFTVPGRTVLRRSACTPLVSAPRSLPSKLAVFWRQMISHIIQLGRTVVNWEYQPR